ncbi:hypothetical protein RJT34_22835 [Clitoria ternatea]|uniref:Uncharacterized protein n=1 Tax=Clitoria ternatea TaxID=43366 RepID=A0AAN9FTL1_CLITE
MDSFISQLSTFFFRLLFPRLTFRSPLFFICSSSLDGALPKQRGSARGESSGALVPVTVAVPATYVFAPMTIVPMSTVASGLKPVAQVVKSQRTQLESLKVPLITWSVCQSSAW